MPGKQARALCPVCQEPMPPDETECDNCGAFVIDEAVVRLSRAFGIPREKALALFEKGFRHPKQLKAGDVDRVLERNEVGLLYICTNCGSFVASAENVCSRCGAEFESEPEPPAKLEERDILDLTLCPVCGADNDPSWKECEICGEPLGGTEEIPKEPEPAMPAVSAPEVVVASPKPEEPPATPGAAPVLERVDELLEDLESSRPEAASVRSAPRVAKVAKVQRSAARPKLLPKPRPESRPAAPKIAARPKEIPANTPTRAAPRPRTPRAGAQPAAPRRIPRMPSFLHRPGPRTETPSPLGTLPPDEFAGGAVVAAGLGLALAVRLGQPMVAWAVALLLALLAAYVVVLVGTDAPNRLTRTDVALLLAAVGLSAAAFALPIGIAPGASVAAAVPLALATRRLLPLPSRSLVTGASAVVLVALALAAAFGLGYAGHATWLVGVAAALPWPLAAAIQGARTRGASAALRRELVRAEVSVRQQDYARSLSDYDRAIALGAKGVPGEEMPWYGKGAALTLLGRYEEALRAIDKALDINPHNEVAWVNKGNALTKLGRLGDALRCFDAALEVNPRYEVAWNNKGNALARMGKHLEAVRCYEKALEIDPGYRGAWVNKGFVLAKLGRYEEATACADRALRLDPRRPATSA